MPRKWTPERVLEMARSHQPACVLTAAVDLDVFTALSAGDMTASVVAGKLRADERGTEILLDALVGLELLEKRDDRYRVPPDVADLLTPGGARHEALAMIQHQSNCLHRWAQLATVVRSGAPAERTPSVRGAAADEAAFIEAMHSHSAPLAERLVAELQPLTVRHLLDVGGASGTWTIAFLRAAPDATATLFDLPHVIPLAKRRLTDEGLAERVKLVAGDFYTDPLPTGADLVWLGAIVHQNSRAQNRDLFRKAHAALAPGGQIVVRDVLMDASHTRPLHGALFAVNMLVATPGGGTFTFDELRADLQSAGFIDATLIRHGELMDSLVGARRPSA